MKTDEKLAEKVLHIYFRKSYYLGGAKLTQEELDFVNNNQFKLIVTEKTKNSGYDFDKEKVAELLKINTPYTLNRMDVGMSNSSLQLVEFPNVNFNSVNFEFLALEDNNTEDK